MDSSEDQDHSARQRVPARFKGRSVVGGTVTPDHGCSPDVVVLHPFCGLESVVLGRLPLQTTHRPPLWAIAVPHNRGINRYLTLPDVFNHTVVGGRALELP